MVEVLDIPHRSERSAVNEHTAPAAIDEDDLPPFWD